MIALLLYYACLIASTWLIFRNAYSIWKSTQDFTLAICTLIFFYFTLGGAYIFPIDAYTNFSGAAIGLHYTPIFDRLFLVQFDGYYFYTCLLYVAFILSFQYTFMFISKRYNINTAVTFTSTSVSNYRINPYVILSLSLFLIIISAWVLREEMAYAISHEKSIYLITRANTNPLYTIHQLANEFSVLIPFIAYTFLIVDSDKFRFGNLDKKSSFYIILLACIISSLYISFLGNRREILSGVVLCILICINHFKQINFKKGFVLAGVVLFFFLANNFFRSTYIPQKINNILTIEKTETIKLKSEDFNKRSRVEFDGKEIAGSFLFSNELFYAHFSLYGIIQKKVELTYGSSIYYLITAVIPRSIYNNRPDDSYTYYARNVYAVPGQNYTIHHAAGWYVNFGAIGVLIGAVLLGCVFVFSFFISSISWGSDNIYLILLKSLMPFLLCAQMVTFISAGPEAYKSLLLEGIVIPIILLRLCFTKTKSTTEA